MDTNPYAPPKALVADRPDATRGLKRRSVFTMIGFTIITLGLYYPIWFLRRRAGLNRLDSPRKLAAWPPTAFILVVVNFVLIDLTFGGTNGRAIGVGPALVLSVLRLFVGVLMLIQCFHIKSIVEDHLAGPADQPHALFVEHVQLSGLMTFFFTIFYLQYAINRHIVDAPERVVT